MVSIFTKYIPGMKIEDGNLICIPEATIQDLKELFDDKEVKVTKQDGEEITEGYLATGYVINIEDKTYNVVKLGDVNGDGRTDAIDLLLIKRYLLNTYEIEGIYSVAGDLNYDKSVDAIDLLLEKRHLLGTSIINL